MLSTWCNSQVLSDEPGLSDRAQMRLSAESIFPIADGEDFEEILFKFFLQHHLNVSSHAWSNIFNPSFRNSMFSMSFQPIDRLCTSLFLKKSGDHVSDLSSCQHREAPLLLKFLGHLYTHFELGIHDLHEAFCNLGVEGLEVHTSAADDRSGVVQVLQCVRLVDVRVPVRDLWMMVVTNDHFSSACRLPIIESCYLRSSFKFELIQIFSS